MSTSFRSVPLPSRVRRVRRAIGVQLVLRVPFRKAARLLAELVAAPLDLLPEVLRTSSGGAGTPVGFLQRQMTVLAGMHRSPLHADDLLQRVNDLDEIALRRHDHIDRLVRARCFIDHVGVLAAFDARRRRGVIFERKALLRLAP